MSVINLQKKTLSKQMGDIIL